MKAVRNSWSNLRVFRIGEDRISWNYVVMLHKTQVPGGSRWETWEQAQQQKSPVEKVEDEDVFGYTDTSASTADALEFLRKVSY